MRTPEAAEQVAKFNRLLDDIIALFEREILGEHHRYFTLGKIDETALATDLFNFAMQFFTKQTDEWQPIVRSALQQRWKAFIEKHGKEVNHGQN